MARGSPRAVRVSAPSHRLLPFFKKHEELEPRLTLEGPGFLARSRALVGAGTGTNSLEKSRYDYLNRVISDVQ